MIRALLLVLLPIALPALLYLGYLKFLKRPAAAGLTDEMERARQRMLFAVVLATAVLAVAAFAYLRVSDSLPPGTKLRAPQLIDGKIVPTPPVE